MCYIPNGQSFCKFALLIKLESRLHVSHTIVKKCVVRLPEMLIFIFLMSFSTKIFSTSSRIFLLRAKFIFYLCINNRCLTKRTKCLWEIWDVYVYRHHRQIVSWFLFLFVSILLLVYTQEKIPVLTFFSRVSEQYHFIFSSLHVT